MSEVVLTVNAELDPLADGGRDSVLGDTHVGAHVHPAHFVQAQHRPHHLLSYSQHNKVTETR